MDITYIMIVVILIFLGIITLFLINMFVLPKKISEIAQMIESGQAKLAIRKINEILENDGRNPYAHYLLAKAYLKIGNKQYAVVEFRQVVKLGRFDDKISEKVVHTELAKLYKERKSMEEAKKEYLLLTKIESANPQNYYELGIIFYNKGVVDKAIGFFKKAIGNDINFEMAYYYMGQLYYKIANYKDAKQSFLDTIKIAPKNYKAHYFLGLVLRQLNDLEWAIKEFEISQKSDDVKVKSFLAKGSCFMEKKQYPKSITEFERGLKYARKGSETALILRYFLADCQEKMRDIHSAIHNWELISEINNNFKDVREKLRSYAEFRQDDRIKDFLIAGLSQFEHLCKKMIAVMNFNLTDINVINDMEIEMIVTEMEGKWRNTRQSNRIIRINRNTETIKEDFLRIIHESMKSKNATRVMIITTGDFSQKAEEFANTRPIELIGKSRLVEILKKLS